MKWYNANDCPTADPCFSPDPADPPNPTTPAHLHADHRFCDCPSQHHKATHRKMPWPWQSGSSSNANSKGGEGVSWNDSLNVKDWDHYKDPRTWIPAFAVTTVFFCGLKFYRTYLRRIPSVEYIHPTLYRKRRLFGKVTSVGDGDGFHLFHTPGGKWAGWGWLRKVPTDRKVLKGKTVRSAVFSLPYHCYLVCKSIAGDVLGLG